MSLCRKCLIARSAERKLSSQVVGHQAWRNCCIASVLVSVTSKLCTLSLKKQNLVFATFLWEDG